MCPEHRTKVLKQVRAELSEGRTCRVIATQLVEAEVDLDFPVVYRALAGVDSIAQATGRCNRNGRSRRGRTLVFRSEHHDACAQLVRYRLPAPHLRACTPPFVRLGQQHLKDGQVPVARALRLTFVAQPGEAPDYKSGEMNSTPMLRPCINADPPTDGAFPVSNLRWITLRISFPSTGSRR